MIVAGRDKSSESMMLNSSQRMGVGPSRPPVLFCLAATIVLGAAARCSAQSTTVDLPNSGCFQTGELSSTTSLIAAERVPVALTAVMQQMEAVLAVPHPEIDERAFKASELLVRLRELRVPVVIDRSAIDDSLDDDTGIRLPLPEARLIDRLNAGLGEFNACLQLFPTHAKIISRDVAEDPEYFVTLTYDVSGISSGPDAIELINLVTQTVDNDAWSMVGNGDQMIIPYGLGRKQLLTISAPWSGHLKVRELFSQLTTVSGYRPGQPALPGVADGGLAQGQAGGSTAVALPDLLGPQTRMERFAPISPEDVRGFGGGGMGGGAFSVR